MESLDYSVAPEIAMLLYQDIYDIDKGILIERYCEPKDYIPAFLAAEQTKERFLAIDAHIIQYGHIYGNLWKALIKNEIPILEYDTEKHAVLMPGERWNYEFTEKAVMLFMEPEIYEYVMQSERLFRLQNMMLSGQIDYEN